MYLPELPMHTETDKIYSTYILVKVKMLIKPLIGQLSDYSHRKYDITMGSPGSQKGSYSTVYMSAGKFWQPKGPYSTVYMSADTFWQPKSSLLHCLHVSWHVLAAKKGPYSTVYMLVGKFVVWLSQHINFTMISHWQTSPISLPNTRFPIQKMPNQFQNSIK